MGLPGGPKTIDSTIAGLGHSVRGGTLCFLRGPPSTIKIGQPFSATIGIPSPGQPDPISLSESSSEAIHLSLRLAENNAAANLLSGNLTSTIIRMNGQSLLLDTFYGIDIAKPGRFRLRALLGVDSGVGVRIASTVNSDVLHNEEKIRSPASSLNIAHEIRMDVSESGSRREYLPDYIDHQSHMTCNDRTQTFPKGT